MRTGDSTHIVNPFQVLFELHRFENSKGVAYSAIYEGDLEVMSCERQYESHMIQMYLETRQEG